MKRNQRGWTIVELLTALVVLFGFIGFCLNIAALSSLLTSPPIVEWGMVVLRVVGVFFPPLGAILGYV